MHKALLTLALLLPVADGEHYGHPAEQCPNGPNSPKPCPNKPKPAPEPAPAPPKPKPDKPLIPDLSQYEDTAIWLVIVGCAALILYGLTQPKKPQP